MSLLRPDVLFWLIVLVGLAPFYLRYRSWEPPSKVFAAWDRRIIWVRLLELAAIGIFLAAIYGWRWDFALTPFPQAAAVAGLILTVCGAALATWSKIQLGVYFSTTLGVKRDHQLITRGPYARVRHPMYTGLLLVLLGGALVYNSGPAVVLLFAPFGVFFYCQSAIEEKLLAARFGAAYEEYRARTGRLLPRVLR